MTEQERQELRRRGLINNYKNELAQLDVKTMKFIDGLITAEEYEPFKQRKATLRTRIQSLERQ